MKFTDFKISIEKSWKITPQVLILIILGIITVVIFSFFCFPKDIYAQEQFPEAPKGAQIIITPQAGITSLSLNKTELKAGEETTGSFIVKGVGDKVLPGIIYRFFLYKYIETGETIKVGEEAGKEITIPKKEKEVFGEKYGEKTLTIIPQQEEKVDFSYKLPPVIPSAEYFFEVEILNERGQKQAAEYLKIKIEGTDNFLSIRDAWILQGELKFGPLIGRGFSPGQEARFQFEIINPSEKEITAIPKITIYPRFSNFPPFKEYSEGEISLAPRETKVLTYNLPKIEIPESYLGNLLFYDKTSNLPISNIQSFRWVIEGKMGEVAKILSLTSDKTVYKKGEKAKISVSYTGPIMPTAPNLVTDKKQGKLVVTIYDNKNKKIGESETSIDLTRLDDVVLEIPIKKDVFSPKIEAKILAENGKELDVYSIVAESKEKPPPESSPYIMYIIAILILIVLIFASLTIYRQLKKKKPALPLFIFIFLISSLCLFLAPQMAKATLLVSCTYTDSNDGNYVCGPDDPNLEGLADGITWSQPMPHGRSFESGANTSTQPLWFYGSVLFTSCINNFGSSEITFSLLHTTSQSNWDNGDWDYAYNLSPQADDSIGDSDWDADFAVPHVDAGNWLALVKLKIDTSGSSCPSGAATCHYNIDMKEHIRITPGPPEPLSITTYQHCLWPPPAGTGASDGSSAIEIGWHNAPPLATRVEIYRCQSPPCDPTANLPIYTLNSPTPSFYYYDAGIPQDTTTATYRYMARVYAPGGNSDSNHHDITSLPKYADRAAGVFFDGEAVDYPEKEVLPGETFEAKIMMKNDGCAFWNSPGRPEVFSLGSQNWEDNTTWGSNRIGSADLSGNHDTGGGGWVTLNVTAPMTPGTYNFQWRMVEEGGGVPIPFWFGEKTSNVAIKVVVPGFSISIAEKSDAKPDGSGTVFTGFTQEYTVTVTSVRGFSGKVNLMSSGAPGSAAVGSACNRCLQACGLDPFDGCDALSVYDMMMLPTPLPSFCGVYNNKTCDTAYDPIVNFYDYFWCHKCDISAPPGMVSIPPNGKAEWAGATMADYFACSTSQTCSRLLNIHFSPGPRTSVYVSDGNPAKATLSVTPTPGFTPPVNYTVYVQGVHNDQYLQEQEKITTTSLKVVVNFLPIAKAEIATAPGGPWSKSVTINPSQTVYFRDGGSSDPDGGSITEYKWDFTNNGFGNSDTNTPPIINPINDFSSSVNGTTDRAYLKVGTYTVPYQVVDDEASSTLDSVTITVTNQAPVAAASCDPSGCNSSDCIAYVGCNFKLKNNSTDPDGNSDIKTSEWDIVGWGSNPNFTPSPPLSDITLPILPAGNYDIILKVTDNAEASSSTTVSVEVKAEASAGFMCSLNNSDGSWQSCDSIAAAKDRLIYFKDDPSLAEYSTPSGGALILSRVWKIDGVEFNSGNNTNPSVMLTAVSHNISLEIMDSANRTASRTHTISAIVVNILPKWKEIPPGG